MILSFVITRSFSAEQGLLIAITFTLFVSSYVSKYLEEGEGLSIRLRNRVAFYTCLATLMYECIALKYIEVYDIDSFDLFLILISCMITTNAGGLLYLCKFGFKQASNSFKVARDEIAFLTYTVMLICNGVACLFLSVHTRILLLIALTIGILTPITLWIRRKKNKKDS